MKRNMDLVRAILLEVEKSEQLGRPIDVKVEGHPAEEITYHIVIMAKAGLIEARDRSHTQGFRWEATRLTWQGHDFLDAARDPGVWKKVMTKIGGTTGTAAFEVIKALLIAEAKHLFGIGG